MKHYESFIFEGHSWNPHARKIVLRYSLDHSIMFEETLILPDEPFSPDLDKRSDEIERAMRALHLIGGISYYKTCLPKKIIINDNRLRRSDQKFWDTVYEHGLGEFFCRNNIDFSGLIKFPQSTEKIEETNMLKRNDGVRELRRILVPIGGGKDSMVAIELLKKTGAKLTLLRMGAHPLIDELALQSGLPLLTVRRSLSPVLFDLNAEGALNGHVPITAYLSILSVLIALLYDFDGVAMSNERSANEGNVIFKGMNINHQWSKSLEFEKLFRRLITESIGTNVEYFSVLRPYSELKIAEIFSKLPQYFPHVTSCNKNWKILAEEDLPSRWCGLCPKCAFVFACLAAFLPKKTLKSIFGSIFFENEALIPLFRELLGLENAKPFECVGTAEETKAAFLLAWKHGDLNETPVMNMFERDVLKTIKDPEALIARTLASAEQHVIPSSIRPLLP